MKAGSYDSSTTRSHSIYLGSLGGALKLGKLQIQCLPWLSLTCPGFMYTPRNEDLFPWTSGMGVWIITPNHVLPVTVLATIRPTFHSHYKLLRHDALAVLSLEPLEIPHPKPGNNPGTEEADWCESGEGCSGKGGCQREKSPPSNSFLRKSSFYSYLLTSLLPNLQIVRLRGEHVGTHGKL